MRLDCRNISILHADKIIFPYRLENGVPSHYGEQEFAELFPEASCYLMQFQEKLSERKADDKAKRFEYGRSQAITKVFGEKLIIPMVMTKGATVHFAGEEEIPYAGYFIKRRPESELTLEAAETILKSPEFY